MRHGANRPVEPRISGPPPGRMTRRQFGQRLLVVGLSASAAGSILAACDADEEPAPAAPPDEPVTLRFWKFISEPDDPGLEEAIERWNAENPGIQIRFETFPFDDYTTTVLTTAFAGGRGPDIFWVSPGLFLDYVNQGIPAPVDDLVAGVRSDYLEAPIEAVTVDGAMQSLPLEMEPVALYYRTDFLEEAGLEPPQTWDELVVAAETLTTGERHGIVVEPASIPHQSFVWYPFLWSAGGEVVNEDSTASALRTPEAASAFELWGHLVREGFAPRELAAISADVGPLGRGETAMHVTGFWAVAHLQSEYPDVEFGVVPIPVPEGGEQVTVYGGWTHMISSESDHIPEAMEFTRWLWVESDDFPRLWACEQNTKFSPNELVNDACADVFQAPPNDIFTNEILPSARAQPPYPARITDAVVDGIQAAMFGGASGEEAAELAADQIDEFLETYDGAPMPTG